MAPSRSGPCSLHRGPESFTAQPTVPDRAQDTDCPYWLRDFLTFKFSQENVLNPLVAVVTWGRFLRKTERLPESDTAREARLHRRVTVADAGQRAPWKTTLGLRPELGKPWLPVDGGFRPQF